jgi:hypothetical protein
MNRLISSKPLLAAAIAFGTLAAASAAHARSDVFFSIGVPAPAPVYVQPHRVYVQPQPVYVQPQGSYYERGYRDHDRRGEWADGDRHYNARVASRRGPWGDADRDGVPNRYDREPFNPYRR